MRKMVFFAAAASMLGFPGTALAQSYNPNAGYENPYPEQTEAARRRGPCSDPWVTIAQERLFGRADPSRCNISLYNNGQWRDYNQLIHAMAARLPRLDCRTVYYARNGSSVSLVCGNVRAGVLNNQAFIIDSQTRASIVAGGGLNLVGQDGASVVATDGAGLVGDGGGTLQARIESKLQSANIVPAPGTYGLQSGVSYEALKASTRR